jgi:hypothetical protein
MTKEEDLEYAVQWYFEAANAGHDEATLNLALLLATGRVKFFVTFAGAPMSLDATLGWLSSHGRVSKEHHFSKYTFALRRIEVLVGELRSSGQRVSKEGTMGTYNASFQRSSSTITPQQSVFEGTNFDDRRPPRAATSSLMVSSSPVRPKMPSKPGPLTPQSRRQSSGTVYASRSNLDLGLRESLTTPYTGLKPLSRQYEALATATSYVSTPAFKHS